MATTIQYIGITSVGIVSISLLLIFFLSNSDFKVQMSENIYCSGNCINPDDTDCIGYFNISSINKNYSIRNKGNINIPFIEPEKVKSFKIEKKISNKWIYVNLSKSQTYKVGIQNEYKIKVCKNNPDDNIKWGVQTLNINKDPIFYGLNLIFIKDCGKKEIFVDDYRYVDRVRNTFSICIKNYTYTYINNITNINETRFYFYNQSCVNGSESYKNYEIVGKHVELVDDGCRNIGLNVSGKIILWGKNDYNCSVNRLILECDSCYDGDCNGVCVSGESCVKINLIDFSKTERLDSNGLKEIET